jgi:hypothetical protein
MVLLYKGSNLGIKSIDTFYTISSRCSNDNINKVREYCILNILNNKFDFILNLSLILIK